MIEQSSFPSNGCKLWILTLALLALLGTPGQAQQQVESTPKAAATATRVLPAGVRSEEVKFSSASVQLAGTLLLPKLGTGQRAPGVLLLGAASSVSREGLKFGKTEHALYRDLAEHLAGQGFAVLRYDKRCTGASECKPKLTFDDLVDDARAGLAYLRGRAEVGPAKAFVFGHGEGGFVAAVVASNDETLAGLVLAAAPGRTLNKLMREQLQFRMKEAGKPESEIAAQLAKFDRVVRTMMSGSGEDISVKLDPQNPFDEVVLQATKQPEYVVPLFINDPLQIANSISAPVLILQGEKDIEASVKDAQYLHEAFSRADHQDHTLRLLPDVDHLLKLNKGAASSTVYADTARPLEASALALISEWLQQRSK